MEKQIDKIVATVKTYTVLFLNDNQKEDLRKAVNLAVLGKEKVNKVNKKTGKIVSDTSKEKEDLVRLAHYNIASGHGITVEWDVTDEGKYINYRVVQGE